MKNLVLIITSNNDIYYKMQQVQKTYIHDNKHFDVYFVLFDEELSEDVKIIEDIIYIRGKETYINILYKTIKALSFIINTLKIEYDFVIRSNISTIINFDNLYKYLEISKKTKLYTGGTLETLEWSLQTYEICEEKQEYRNSFFGLKYIQGTSIILSYDVIKTILSYEKLIKYDVVDDVKLGLLIRCFCPDIYENIDKILLPKLTYNNFTEDSVFIRNKTKNRILDIYNMRNFIDNFININTQQFDKVIHITYKNIEQLEYSKSQWLKLNPKYRVELYDNSRCVDFLNYHFGRKYGDIFNYIKDGPIKSDFFRICVLYICGGVYVDADIKPLVPLDEFIDDDLYFSICVSYNYKKENKSFNYNPHFIISKKYNSHLYDSIKIYEKYYDEEKPYSYWGWSICTIFNMNIDFDISNNKFFMNNKKYQVLIEKPIKDNIYYDFTNILNENKGFKVESFDKVVCSYNDKIVLDNFINKQFL